MKDVRTFAYADNDSYGLCHVLLCLTYHGIELVRRATKAYFSGKVIRMMQYNCEKRNKYSARKVTRELPWWLLAILNMNVGVAFNCDRSVRHEENFYICSNLAMAK